MSEDDTRTDDLVITKLPLEQPTWCSQTVICDRGLGDLEVRFVTADFDTTKSGF